MCLSLWGMTAGGQADRAQHSVLGTMTAVRAQAPARVGSAQAHSLYVLHCSGCHGLDGRGHPQADVPDLHHLPAFLAVEGGREFLIRVPGVMGSGLNDEEVAQVMNWILRTYLPPEQLRRTPPYQAHEVTTARTQPMPDVLAVRQRLLTATPAR